MIHAPDWVMILWQNNLLSWLCHAVFAVLLTFLVGPVAAVTPFAWVELRHISWSWTIHQPITAMEWGDHFMDVLVPMVAVALLQRARKGWGRTRPLIAVAPADTPAAGAADAVS